MKKFQIGLAAAMMLSMLSCTSDEQQIENPVSMEQKTVTFTFGDVLTQHAMTRADVSSLDLTDIWMFDYVGDELQQTVHQSNTNEGFGTISASMGYGEHTIYFVASRGDSPVIDGTTISWTKPSDTFWASRSITIAPSTSASQTVSLQRVATRLRLTVMDEIPATLAQICITPSHWYYGIDYLTGEATDDRQTERTINVPASYIGTTGQLYANFYSMSPSSAWQTDITMKAKDGDGGLISQIGIADVPLERNRVTNYSGPLFSVSRTSSVTADGEWGEDISGTW